MKSEQLQPVMLASRQIPPPTSISAQAREYLSAAAQQNTLPSFPSLDDAAGWKTLIANMDQMLRARMAGFDQHVQHESTTLGDVPVFLITPNNLPARLPGYCSIFMVAR